MNKRQIAIYLGYVTLIILVTFVGITTMASTESTNTMYVDKMIKETKDWNVSEPLYVYVLDMPNISFITQGVCVLDTTIYDGQLDCYSVLDFPRFYDGRATIYFSTIDGTYVEYFGEFIVSDSPLYILERQNGGVKWIQEDV